jgi:hypothetical protein
MNKPWPWLFLLLSLFACCGSWITTDLRSPARQADATIQADILRQTPIGTKYSDGREYIDSHFGQVFTTWPEQDGKTVNHTYVEYGSYTQARNFPFANVVRIHWYFNADGVLERISVSRYLDCM